MLSLEPSLNPTETSSKQAHIISSVEPSSTPSLIPSTTSGTFLDEPGWTTYDPTGIWNGKTCT